MKRGKVFSVFFSTMLMLSACATVEDADLTTEYIELSEKLTHTEEVEITDKIVINTIEKTIMSEKDFSIAETAENTKSSTESEAFVEAEPETEKISEAEVVTEISENMQENDSLYQMDFLPDDDYVKIIGRTYRKSDGTRILAQTCSGIEFEFTGSSADITMTSNCRESKARVAVYVNGEIVIDTMLDNKETVFRVFESEAAEKNVVKVVKLSEAAYSYAGVKKISVVSKYGIVPTPEHERKIEFIGDSITCGYGVDAENAQEKFFTSNENGSKTYAAIVADHFNADASFFSWSGVGVYSSYTETSSPNRTVLMPELYSKIDPTYTPNAKWDFSQWQPNVVVITLGTNDNTWTKGIEERVNIFGEAYYNFIVQVREANPDAYIICAHGVLENKLMPEIKEQVERYSSNTSDTKIAAFEFNYQNGEVDGYGSDYHPSAKTQIKMAEQIIPFISELMGWD